ncbi:butyrate response factor [Nematocida sp. AWRm77]|nr:butyrate response factor [Nematocida sp. AWRm77]
MAEHREVFNIKVIASEFEGIGDASAKEKKKPKKIISKKKISLYKTEICKSFEENNFCPYGDKCQFAHSLKELRDVERHPRYKTELCKTYTTFGTCSYGKRCCFIHAGPRNDTDTDLQDARNLPGDWKAPGILKSTLDIEMSEIGVDEPIKRVDVLTEEENEKLCLLGKYKSKTPSTLKNFSRCFTPTAKKDFIEANNSSSLIWLKSHMCFIFVDSGCKISSISPLGKAPGTVSINKAVYN